MDVVVSRVKHVICKSQGMHSVLPDVCPVKNLLLKKLYVNDFSHIKYGFTKLSPNIEISFSVEIFLSTG